MDGDELEVVPRVPLAEEFDDLTVFLVGDSARDQFLARLHGGDAPDGDSVTLGVVASPDELENRGFESHDGVDSPAFEDSLGREVIPVADGIDEFLGRDNGADLTVDATAIGIGEGDLHDPHGGIGDIRDRTLRHTADGAFADDAALILRVARLAAELGFGVAPETEDRMRDAADGLSELAPERLGEELLAALGRADRPRRFFDVLASADALTPAYPEVGELDGVPAGPEGTHEEGDSLEHTLQVVEAMQELRPNDVDALLAALGHDLGKGVTPEDIRPSHNGHAKRGVGVAERLQDRIALPDDRCGTMQTGARQHMRLHSIRDLNATTVLDMAKRVRDSPLTVEQLAAVGEADSNGREPTRPYYADEVREKLSVALEVVEEVTAADAIARRGMDADAVDDGKAANLVRQDRAEEYRKRL